MRILWLIIIALFSSAGLYSQITMELKAGDTTYTFTDPDYELLTAASDGDTAKIRAFLKIGTNVNTSTWEGATPLMFAAQNGHLPAVEMLIDEGAQINRKPYSQIDALMGAVIAGHVHVADTLILNGADVNTRNIDGLSPLMYAAAFNEYLLSDVLIFYGAKVSTSDNFGNYPIHYSAFYGNLDVCNLLMDHGADMERTDRTGFTPLMIASQNGHLPLVAFLLDQGADLSKTNDENCTPLSLALMNRLFETADYLLQRGANANHFIIPKTNHYELALEHGGKEMASLIENYGGSPVSNFMIRKMTVNFDMNWNSQDVMMGGSFGLLESVLGWEAELGFRTRPWVRSIRYEQDGQTFYQFWEKRSLFYLGAGKRFSLAQPQPWKQFGLFAMAAGGYTYGSFRGSDRKPDDTFLFIPKGGIYFNNKSFTSRLNYEYMKIPNTGISPHRISLSIGLLINLQKTNFKKKQEPAL